MSSMYYKDVDGGTCFLNYILLHELWSIAILVCDVKNEKTVEKLKDWYDELKSYNSDRDSMFNLQLIDLTL